MTGDARITGLHHVTALAARPAENAAFYTDVLGLRLVKRTVNFDDPYVYHLYYGDAAGSPGSLLTHFPHPHAKQGVRGTPEITRATLRVPIGSLDFWQARLAERHIDAAEDERDGTPRLTFDDPHAMRLAIIQSDRPAASPWSAPGIDEAHAITSVQGVAIETPHTDAAQSFLQETLGFEVTRSEGDRTTLAVPGSTDDRDGVELVHVASAPAARMGAGTIHHVAWRVPTDEAQTEIAARIADAGVNVTPVIDRQYFRSIYFRIPGGVIFEIATDAPGFAVDEPAESLGTSLKLPPQYEPRRAEIEKHVAPLA